MASSLNSASRDTEEARQYLKHTVTNWIRGIYHINSQESPNSQKNGMPRTLASQVNHQLDSKVTVQLTHQKNSMLTLGQAAKQVGKSKTALTNAIKEKRLPAEKLANGQYQIDPTELFKIYPKATQKEQKHSQLDHQVNYQVNHQVNYQDEQLPPPIDTLNLQRETELLREMIGHLKDERDDLRRRLDATEAARQRETEAREQASAELRRLTYFLTLQPSPEQPEATESGKGKLWEKLFGNRKQT